MMEKLIFTTTARILEDWAMMLVDPASPELKIFEVESPFLVASLSFRGAVNGTYQVVCQRGFSEALVANLLGEDVPEDNLQSEMDALREMVNVLSGNLLTTCYGSDTVFELMPPEVHQVAREKLTSLFEKPVFCYLADDNPVAVSFSLDV